MRSLVLFTFCLACVGGACAVFSQADCPFPYYGFSFLGRSFCNWCFPYLSTAKVTVKSDAGTPLTDVAITTGPVGAATVLETTVPGQYEIRAIRCTEISATFTKDGYVSITATIDDFEMGIVLEDDVLEERRVRTLIFTANPQDKYRSPGDSVKLCCEATGDTTPITYQWQKADDTGVFVDISMATTNVLELTNLQSSDAGLYRCIASTQALTRRSGPGRLIIKDNLCAEPEVTRVSVDAPFGTVLQEISRCSGTPCQPDVPIPETCGPEEEVSLARCLPVAFELVGPVWNETECSCGPSATPPQSLRFAGNVVSASDMGMTTLTGIQVTTGDIETTTDANGRFLIIVSNPRLGSYVITFSDDSGGYFSTSKIVPAASNSDMTVAMSPKVARTINVMADQETIVDIPGPATVEMTFPAGAIVDSETGEPVVGDITMFTRYLTPNEPEVPGLFVSIDSEGEERPLESLGVLLFDVESGVAFQGPVTISFGPVGTDIDLTPFKIFGLNKKTGKWDLIEGQSSTTRRRRQTGDTNSIDIDMRDFREFDGYNIDQFPDICYIQVIVFDVSGNLIQDKNLAIETISTFGNSLMGLYGRLYTKDPSNKCIQVSCRDDGVSRLIVRVKEGPFFYLAQPTSLDFEFFTDTTFDVSLATSDDTGPVFSSETACKAGVNPLIFGAVETEDTVSLFYQPSLGAADVSWYPNRSNKNDTHPYQVCFAKVVIVVEYFEDEYDGEEFIFYARSYRALDGSVLGTRSVPVPAFETACVEYRCSGEYNRQLTADPFEGETEVASSAFLGGRECMSESGFKAKRRKRGGGSLYNMFGRMSMPDITDEPIEEVGLYRENFNDINDYLTTVDKVKNTCMSSTDGAFIEHFCVFYSYDNEPQ